MPEITRDQARQLVGRFSEFAAPPAMNEGLSQTIDTLIASARSMSHAKRIVETIIDSPGGDGDRVPRWPTSERIRKVAWDLLTDDQKALKCDKCNGTGWISVERKGIWGAAPCSCRPAPPADDGERAKPASKPTRAEFAESWVK